MVSIVFSCDTVLFFLSSVPPLSLPSSYWIKRFQQRCFQQTSRLVNPWFHLTFLSANTLLYIFHLYLSDYFSLCYWNNCQSFKLVVSFFIFCTMLATPFTTNYKCHVYIFLLIYNVSFQIHFEHFKQHILSFALTDIWFSLA